MQASPSIFRRLTRWLGWPGLLLLVLVVVGVGVGLYWERNRHAPLPPEAGPPSINNAPDFRQTAYFYTGTLEQLRMFYADELAARGWQRCGDGGTPGCSNLPQLVGRDSTTIDVYRRMDDQNGRGPTVEIWPIESDDSIYVTMYETRAQN